MAFEIDGAVIDLLYCHCSMCRKAHGSAFRARGKVRASQFRWVRGEELVRYYQSSPGQHRGFCSVCSSNLLTKFDEKPRVLGLALGVLDDDPVNRPICHVFVGSKAPWHEITDDLPQFEQDPTGPVAPKVAMTTQADDRRVDTFFYGLFMDESVLRDSGVTPVNPRPACVVDFALRIGQRATLVPSQGAMAFGIVMSLTHADLDILYSGPGLEHYKPEAVVARGLKGLSLPALCFNLTDAPDPEERNPEYAKRLQGVLHRLGFPREYVESLR